MLRHASLSVVGLCMFLLGCEETRKFTQPAAANVNVTEDAALPLLDASLPPPAPEELAAWLAADSFSVELKASTCYGTCPSFSVRIDQDGHVSYRGAIWVARPGFYEIDVPAAKAKTLFESMISEGFLRLRERYEEKADGCVEVITDAPTYTFSLRAGERSKRVEIYRGCESSASSFQRRFVAEIQRVTNVGLFLYPTPSGPQCAPPEDFPREKYEQSWILEDFLERKDSGILRMDGSHWSVFSCDGTELARGDTSSGIPDRDQRLLLPAAENPAAFAWPGLDEPQGVAMLSRTSLPNILVTLLTLNEQHKQFARPGDACTRAP